MRLSPKEFVPSGSYRTNRTDQGRLIALLGTCIGVAISDRQAGVGGLAHFLLPKPVGTTSLWQPLNYASTGLPIFLAELEKQQQLELRKKEAELRKQQAEQERQKQAELEKVEQEN